ncbi:MAG: HAD family phosphatase [Bacteroidales bacterium]|nr:HAD family phosphatase [Bacteroidales bacterium]
MIKNIVLDLGGVIINIDYQLTIKAFEELGITNASKFYSQQQQTNLFDLLETGKISEAGFRDEIRKFAGKNLSDNNIDTAWNAMLLDFPPERMETLKQLKSHYRTFLLSNTNAIHFTAYTKTLIKNFGKNNLSDYFHKEYYSHLIHRRKPHPDTFRFVLKDQNLLPQETLFIDDSEQHIHGAKSVNLQTHLLVDETLENYLESSNLL